MKKIFAFLLVCCLIFPASAAALDGDAIHPGMGGRSWNTGYVPESAYGILTVHVPVTVSEDVEDLTAELVLDNASPFEVQDLEASASVSDGKALLTWRLSLYDDRVNGDYPAHVQIGDTSFPLVISIRDGVENTEILHPIFSDLKVDLQPGAICEMTVTLTNPSMAKPMNGPELTVSGDHIFMEGSNKLRISDLLPGESREITLNLAVQPEAKANLQQIHFALSWNSFGKPESWEEDFSVLIRQTIRMEHGGVKNAAVLFQNTFSTLSIPILNLGKGSLQNVTAALTLPGLTEENTVLVGTLAPGETKEAQMGFTPGTNAEGNFSGTITVTAEDDWGNPAEFSVPLSLTVQPPPVQALPEQEATLPHWVFPVIILLSVLLAAASVTAYVFLQKYHKVEEERL